MEKIKVGIVNYLNTRPLLYGIEHSPVKELIELVPDYPAQVAHKLLTGITDVGIVPVAVIPQLSEYHIITEYCIGCNGPVASVGLFSERPVEEIDTVLLDYQSRTSVALAKILLEEYWHIKPVLIDTQTDFRAAIKDRTAGIIIGDRALEQRKTSPYFYDLGEAWKAHTGLPFVFAAWVSNKQLPKQFVHAFNAANKLGLQHIDEVVAQNPYALFNLKQYYTQYISYELDLLKREALQLFLQKLGTKKSRLLPGL